MDNCQSNSLTHQIFLSSVSHFYSSKIWQLSFLSVWHSAVTESSVWLCVSRTESQQTANGNLESGNLNRVMLTSFASHNICSIHLMPYECITMQNQGSVCKCSQEDVKWNITVSKYPHACGFNTHWKILTIHRQSQQNLRESKHVWTP